MKFKTFILIFFISLCTISPIFFKGENTVFASGDNSYIINANDEKLTTSYLEFYSIPTSLFTYSNNGGELSGNELSKAFDRNFSTSFKSSQDNNVDYVDQTSGETKHNFINTIDVTFSKSVKLDKILYSSENGTTRGYPTNLNLYCDTGNGFELINNYQTTETTSFVVFEFGNTYDVLSFRFEYVKVSTSHKYCATAKEIIFLQPESEDYELYQNMFTDYSQTTLNQNLNTLQKLEAFEETLQEYVNFESLSPKIERAKKVLSGDINFNENLEFSTNLQSKNKIERLGDLESYARNVLKLAKFGTNRQVLGISANAGDQITIYVTANANDPLPKIRFSQHMGHWRSWLGGEIQLSLGENTFTVPSFYHQDYSVDVCLGGPIYLVNPYTSSQQSENVKIYVEGGTLYPVLTKNTNTKEYLESLDTYCEYYQNDTNNVVNVTEIVTDHTIITVNATYAKEIYSTISPSQTISNWNAYMDQLLNFGGIYQDSTNPLFDERNLNVKVNIRIVQPWDGGWMFAAGEHVGVRESSQSVLINASGFGWGVTHELGHMLDINERTVSETTNNMWSKYNETVLELVGTRGSFDNTLKTLSNDKTYSDIPYFVTNKQNYLIWWYLEAWQKGYWANLENCYRGIYPTLTNFLNQFQTATQKLNSISPSEKQVFFSSLITGIDLSYYFERWGFSINNTTSDPVFNITTASDDFNSLMNLAIQHGLVDNTKQPKLWYQNAKFYYYTESSTTYNNNFDVSIKLVSKTSTGYNIFINPTSATNHLGFEIYEGNDIDGFKVIGFTYDTIFQDTTTYDSGYVPTYKVVAVDQTFATSKISTAKTIENANDIVCKINDNEFTNLKDAVDFASDGDVIEILKSFYTINITIDKNLTIKLNSDVNTPTTITKIESGNLFTIASNITLNIEGNENNLLILDGFNFNQTGALINAIGIINCNYIKFKNNISTINGGAIIFQNGSKGSIISNCHFINNSAPNGASISIENANISVTISNSSFDNNVSSNNGIILNKGTITINDTIFSNNTAPNSIIKNYDGGVLYINNCNFESNNITSSNGYLFSIDGYSEIKNSTISASISSYNSIYYSAGNSARKLNLDNINFQSQNSCNFIICVASSASTLSLNNISTNKNIYLTALSGTIKIKDNCNLGNGNISITNGANIILVNNIFENYMNCHIELLQFDIGIKVLSVENFELTNTLVSNVSTLISSTTYGPIETTITLEKNGNAIYANPDYVALILNYDTGSKLLKYRRDEIISLYLDIFDTTYITEFKDENEKKYTLNDTITLSQNLAMNITLENKLKIVFKAGKVSKTEYYIPNEQITLPGKINKNLKILKWKINDKKFDVDEQMIVTTDLTLTASYINLPLVITIPISILLLVILITILVIRRKKLKRSK